MKNKRRLALYNIRKSKDAKLPENFTEEDYKELYNLIKDSVKVVRYIRRGSNIKYITLTRIQRLLSEGKYKQVPKQNCNMLYRMVRDARRAMGNPALANLDGARIVNDIFDMIDNISGTKPADVESGMVELKDTIRNMNQLNEEAKIVSKKCEVISNNLSNICEYMSGNVEELSVEQK